MTTLQINPSDTVVSVTTTGTKFLGSPNPAEVEALRPVVDEWATYGPLSPLNRNAQGVPQILAAALERHALAPTLIFGGSPLDRRSRVEDWLEQQPVEGLTIIEETIIFDPLAEIPPRYAIRNMTIPQTHGALTVTLPAMLTTKETADYLGIKEQTLRSWRAKEEPPPWVNIGRSVRYRADDIAEFIEQNRSWH